MLTERLAQVALHVKEEQELMSVMVLLQAVESALSASVSSPTSATADAFDLALDKLYGALDSCMSNQFVPSDARILASIDSDGLTGDRLRMQIENILATHNITPAAALLEIQQLRQRVTGFIQTLNALLDAFEELGLPVDGLEEGTAEIGILLPSALVNDSIEGLTKELRLFDRHLRHFSELAGGDVGSFQIRAIQTGSYDVFLQCTPVVAAGIMLAVERLVALYKNVLEVRLLKKKLAEKDIPEKALAPVGTHMGQMVQKSIDQLGKDILQEYCKVKDSSRKNELSAALGQALRFLGDRIDRGVDIEASVRLIASDGEETDAKLGGEGDMASPAAITVRASVAIRSLSRSGEPVLRLPEGDRQKLEEQAEERGERDRS